MSDSIQETRSLADAMFDGTINAAGVEQLEHLIGNDLACLQAYLEVIHLNGALERNADFPSSRRMVTSILEEISTTHEKRKATRQRLNIVMGASACLLVTGLLSWLLMTSVFRPVPFGNIAHLTANARFGATSLELGQVIRNGSSIAVEEGIVSIELPHAMVDLHGPVEIRLNAAQEIQLQRGVLTARVQAGGEGLTVRTPDAEVVDLGTEFLVRYDAGSGTEVSVRQGRARASLIDGNGIPLKTLELTASRSAQLQQSANKLVESRFDTAPYQQADRARGKIRSITGQLRTSPVTPPSLVSDESPTRNHLLIIPERQSVTLTEDLTVETLDGTRTYPAGAVLSSYLIHYDPTLNSSFAPRGAVTFYGKLVGAIVQGSDLTATDLLFGHPEITYDTNSFRGLELKADEIRVSDDRETVSFFFAIESPHHLDQVRLLVAPFE